MHTTHRRGLTQIELLACVFIGLVVGILVLAFVERTRTTRPNPGCGSNLRQIGLAMLVYAQDQRNGSFPRVEGDVALVSGGYEPGAPGSVPAALFLLIKYAELTPDVFICPNAGHSRDGMQNQTAQRRHSFTGPENLSYGFANPWGDPDLGYRWNNKVSPEFVIAAERNDGNPTAGAVNTQSPRSLRSHNSRNHRQDGQFVLYGDGHAEWHETPFAGAHKSHIYLATEAVDGVPPDDMRTWGDFVPTWSMDTVILPRP